jgi:hypothetical protein
MVQQHAAHALRELLEVEKTPSSSHPVLQHALETFKGMQMRSAARWQKMPMQLRMPVGQRRGELFRPMDTTAIDRHDDLLPRAAKDRHSWRDIWTKRLGIARRDDFIADL